MRAAVFTAFGCALLSLMAAGLLVLVGLILQAWDLQLYGSEADQQRNFNLAMLFVAAAGMLGGWYGYRRSKK
jgi:hypothetical protein